MVVVCCERENERERQKAFKLCDHGKVLYSIGCMDIVVQFLTLLAPRKKPLALDGGLLLYAEER